jgi:hypothetical protein
LEEIRDLMEKCMMAIYTKARGRDEYENEKKKIYVLPDTCSQVAGSCREELACGAGGHRDDCFKKLSVDLLFVW